MSTPKAEFADQNKPRPEPFREQIEVLARDLPKLWAADSTTDRDRKRLLRAMIVDITLTSQPTGRELQVGIRWRSGASQSSTRPSGGRPARRSSAPRLRRSS